MKQDEIDNLIWHVAIQWLASKGLLNQWLLYSNVPAPLPEYLIMNMCGWGNTEEGEMYWREICREWQKFYNTLQAWMRMHYE